MQVATKQKAGMGQAMYKENNMVSKGIQAWKCMIQQCKCAAKMIIQKPETTISSSVTKVAYTH